LTALPGKVIDADDAHRGGPGRHRAPTHHPQQRISADRQHQAAGQTGRGTPTQSDADVVDNRLKPRRASRRLRRNIGVQHLAEDLSTTSGIATTKAANLNTEAHALPVRGKVQ
jgi:hypothetical protein